MHCAREMNGCSMHRYCPRNDSTICGTIPVTIKSMLSTSIVPETIVRFEVPFGATVNMDGTAIYFAIDMSTKKDL